MCERSYHGYVYMHLQCPVAQGLLAFCAWQFSSNESKNTSRVSIITDFFFHFRFHCFFFPLRPPVFTSVKKVFCWNSHSTLKHWYDPFYTLAFQETGVSFFFSGWKPSCGFSCWIVIWYLQLSLSSSWWTCLSTSLGNGDMSSYVLFYRCDRIHNKCNTWALMLPNHGTVLKYKVKFPYAWLF